VGSVFVEIFKAATKCTYQKLDSINKTIEKSVALWPPEKAA
jgi:hypothetical protein